MKTNSNNTASGVTKKVTMKKVAINAKPVQITSEQEPEKDLAEPKRKVIKVIKGKKAVETSKEVKPAAKKAGEPKKGKIAKTTEPIEVKLKYKYPEDTGESLTRKKFRHDARAKEAEFKKLIAKAKDNPKEFKKLEKEYNDFRTATYK